MMNFFGKLFGSDKVVDAGIAAADKVWFTEEEKVDVHMQFLKIYQPFKLAQRYLAILFGTPYALAWMTTFIAAFWIDVTPQKEMLSGDMATIVGVIFAFYFGGGAIEGIIHGKDKPIRQKSA